MPEISPADIAPPAAGYAHAVLTTSPARWLHTSGVVPITADGSVPAGTAEQARVVWRNIAAMLREARMRPSDVVSVTTWVVADRIDELGAVMAVRDEALGGHRAASTLVTVPALARPEWKVEITVVAASSPADV